jgi:hypothetical protein
MRPDIGDLDALHERADTLAQAWGARARATTTAGQERALLSSLGVSGLDHEGRPLAGAAVDRWRSDDPRGLSGGIGLPFAMALLEYDLTPQRLALDVASGAVDLALEARLLRQPDRRAVAEAEASRLAATAVEQIDANRTARHELLDVLGDAERPWLGVTLVDAEIEDALARTAALAEVGVDLYRVEVPFGRELADRLTDAGRDVPAWQPTERPARETDRGARETREPAPTGSQRGLAELRGALDEIAAERRAYVRLASAAPALSAPEGAVVAAFERVDLVDADPMAEIVDGGVDPDRALADHAFAHRLHRRSGALISIGAGPLVVAPDLSTGVPSSSAIRAGRALALQLLSVALARAAGLPAEQIVVGGLPAWLIEEPHPGARAAAEVVVRRRLFEGHPLRFDQPATTADGAIMWQAVLTAVLPLARGAALILVDPGAGPARVASAVRAASAVAADLAPSTESSVIAGPALDHARLAVAEAGATLERLADVGWRAVIGDGPGGGAGPAGSVATGLGAGSVAERTESFDPFEIALGPRG